MAGVLIIAVAVVLFSREISFVELWEVVKGVNKYWLLLALVVSFISHASKALRWKRLLSPKPDTPAFFDLFKYTLTGQLVNLFVPGRVGDLGRAVFAGKHGPGTLFSLGTVALEKVLDLIIYALLATVLLIFVPLPAGLVGSPGVFFGIALVILAALWFIVQYYETIFRILSRYAKSTRFTWLERLVNGMEAAGDSLAVFKKNNDVFALTIWTVVIWFTSALVNYLLFHGLNLDLPITAAFLLLVVLQLGISTNLVPGTIGIFEFLCVLSLRQFGVPYSTALGYGLILHALIFTPLVFGGVATLISGSAVGNNVESKL